MSKRLGGIMGCKYKTSSWHSIGFHNGMVVTLGQKYHVREKPTAILYTLTLIAMQGHPTKSKTKDTMSLDSNLLFVTMGLCILILIEETMGVHEGNL